MRAFLGIPSTRSFNYPKTMFFQGRGPTDDLRKASSCKLTEQIVVVAVVLTKLGDKEKVCQDRSGLPLKSDPT